MIFYVSVNNVLILLRYALKGHGHLRNQLYPVVLIGLFVFAAFRFEVGCDWTGYLNQWNVQEYRGVPWQVVGFEPTWWSIMSQLQSLGIGYPWLNVAAAAVFFVGVHFLARRQPDPLGFLVLLFPILIINMPMSGIRQGAAIGLICIALVAFIDRKILSFAAWVVLASTIHSSALVFLLLLPLVRAHYSKERVLLAVLLAVPGAYLMTLGDAAEQAFSRYVDTQRSSGGAVFRVAVPVLTGVAYFMMLRKHWEKAYPQDYKLVSVGALLMFGLAFLLPLSSVIADRAAYYLIPIQTIIFARIPYLQLRTNKMILTAAPYLGLALIFFVWTFSSWHFRQCYVPYETWLLGYPASGVYTY